MEQPLATANVDDRSPWLGNTPLHIAVKYKQIRTVKSLVWDLHADCEVKNKNGQTPIDLCKKFAKEDEG